MTIREFYNDVMSEVLLLQAFRFLGVSPSGSPRLQDAGPDIDIDKKHNKITFSDPDNAKTRLLFDTENLALHNGKITAGTVAELHVIVNGKDAVTLTGVSIAATGLNSVIASGGAEGLYQFFADNLRGNLIARGDHYDNTIEVGAGGKATVDAGAGNDLVEIWHNKNAVIDGGKGIDTIEFSSYAGTPPITEKIAKIDLAAGTGTNPYGGSLTVENIENITNRFNGPNDFRGDGQNNVFFGGSHADILMGRGGNDQIYIRPNFSADPRATMADGGTGKDTLNAELTEGAGAPFTGSGDDIRFHNKLDLEHPGDNLGTFHGGTFKNFETFRVTGFLNKDVFDFSGSNAAEQVFSAGSDDPLDGRGGDDLLSGGAGADILTGGTGADKFQYSATTDSTANPALRDTITDFSRAQHDRIDLHLIDADTTGGANDKFKFMEDGAFDGHAGEVYAEQSGGDTFVFADTNGDKAPDLVILIDGGPKLVEGDFVL